MPGLFSSDHLRTEVSLPLVPSEGGFTRQWRPHKMTQEWGEGNKGSLLSASLGRVGGEIHLLPGQEACGHNELSALPFQSMSSLEE